MSNAFWLLPVCSQASRPAHIPAQNKQAKKSHFLPTYTPKKKYITCGQPDNYNKKDTKY